MCPSTHTQALDSLARGGVQERISFERSFCSALDRLPEGRPSGTDELGGNQSSELHSRHTIWTPLVSLRHPSGSLAQALEAGPSSVWSDWLGELAARDHIDQERAAAAAAALGGAGKLGVETKTVAGNLLRGRGAPPWAVEERKLMQIKETHRH